MDIDRYLDLKIDMFLETQRVDGKKNIHINVYPKYSLRMIIHKVNNCSRGIHTTIFKIKTILIQTIKENVTCAKIGHPNCSQIRIKIAKKKKKREGKSKHKIFPSRRW